MSENIDWASKEGAGIAFARGLALIAADQLKYRTAYSPELIPQSDGMIQMALVTPNGDRFRVEVEYAGNEVDTEAAAMLEP